jgi:copper transport protein
VLSALVTLVALPANTALAHNSLVSTDPADGAQLSVAPTQISWVFDKSVPLDTMTITLTGSDGVRSDLLGSTYGRAGDTTVVTPLPALQPGAVSLRWRLVGPDGHTITGRVEFTIASPVAPVDNVSPPTTVAPPLADDAATNDDLSGSDDAASSTPSVVRWVLRFASYAAIMTSVGVLITTAFVWAAAGSQPLLRRVLSRSLLVVAVLALLQLLVVASDVSGKAPWSSFGSVDAALTTDAGLALAIRIALAGGLWLLLFPARVVHREVYWTAVSMAGVSLLATWAFAGHSRSLRWPAVGVTADVAHHAAAAAWIAGLAIVGWIAVPAQTGETVVATVRRFSNVAAVSVGVLVITGLMQSLRLVGNPLNLFEQTHGRLLVAKVVLLAIMLGLANENRRRVNLRLNDPLGVDNHVTTIRQSMIVEFAIGLVIVAITAAMVVSTPATSSVGTGGSSVISSIYYIM